MGAEGGRTASSRKSVWLGVRWLLAAVLIAASVGRRTYGGPLPSTTDKSPMEDEGNRGIVVPLGRGGDFLFVKMRVNGADVGWWVIDTADPGIVIDAAVAQRLGLPVVSKVWGAGRDDPDASLVLVDKLQVGDAPARRHLAVATDLSQQGRPAGVNISGILGWGFLQDQPFSIDFRAAALKLFAPGAVLIPPKPDYEGTLRLVRGAPTIHGEIAGLHSGWFTIDSGEESSLVLEPWFVGTHPEVFSPPPPLAELPRGEAAMNYQIGALHLLGKTRSVVADWQWPKPPIELPPHAGFLACAHVGAPFLQDLRLTVDPQHGRIWAERFADEPTGAMLARLGEPTGHDLGGATPFMRAAAQGRADAIASLLDRGADVNAADAQGRTPLMRACEAGSIAAVKLLLARGAKVDARDGGAGYTAMMRAAAAGNTECVEALLAAGAQPDLADHAGHTPLFWAAVGDRGSTIDRLLSRGARPALAGRDRMSPLVAASELSALGALRALLKDGLPQPDSKTARTPLMEAALHNATGAVRELIRAGAAVNARAADGKTALMEAAAGGATDAIRLLLNAGADPRVRSAEGKDAFDCAVRVRNAYSLLLLYAATHRRDAAASGPASRPRSVILRAQRAGPFLALPASINGQQPLPMLLDTGALGTFIDRSLAEQFHLKRITSADIGIASDNSGKTTPGTIVEIPSLQIGEVKVGPTLGIATDLSSAASYLGIRGPLIFGMPFVDAAMRLDFPAAEVEVCERGAIEPPAGTTEIPLRTMNGSLLSVPAVLFGTDHVLLGLDTGAGGDFGMILFGPYPLLHRPELGPWFDHDSMRGATGSRDTMRYRLSEVEALGHRSRGVVVNVPVASPDEFWPAPPGVIGAGMLQKCSLCLDPANGRAWAKWLPDHEPLDAVLRRIGTEAKADLLHTSPLMRAINEGRRDAVAALLKRGADLDETDTTGRSALQMACNEGDEQAADLLLDSHAKGRTEDLQPAAAHGLADVVDRLLNAGVSPGKDAASRLSVLEWAVVSNDARCVESLLAAGADPNGKDQRGSTALMVSAGHGCAVTAEVLLKHRADVEAALPDGMRPLMSAVKVSDPKVAAVLLAHGANVDAADNDGKTALIYAAEDAVPDIVRLLLKAGAKPDLANREGGTALDYAAGTKNFQNAELIYFSVHPAP